jgi:hypothetical protein
MHVRWLDGRSHYLEPAVRPLEAVGKDLDHDCDHFFRKDASFAFHLPTSHRFSVLVNFTEPMHGPITGLGRPIFQPGSAAVTR